MSQSQKEVEECVSKPKGSRQMSEKKLNLWEYLKRNVCVCVIE